MVVGPRVMKFGVCDPQVGSNNRCKVQIDTTKFRFLRPILLYMYNSTAIPNFYQHHQHKPLSGMIYLEPVLHKQSRQLCGIMYSFAVNKCH